MHSNKNKHIFVSLLMYPLSTASIFPICHILMRIVDVDYFQQEFPVLPPHMPLPHISGVPKGLRHVLVRIYFHLRKTMKSKYFFKRCTVKSSTKTPIKESLLTFSDDFSVSNMNDLYGRTLSQHNEKIYFRDISCFAYFSTWENNKVLIFSPKDVPWEALQRVYERTLFARQTFRNIFIMLGQRPIIQVVHVGYREIIRKSQYGFLYRILCRVLCDASFEKNWLLAKPFWWVSLRTDFFSVLFSSSRDICEIRNVAKLWNTRYMYVCELFANLLYRRILERKISITLVLLDQSLRFFTMCSTK